MTDNINVQMKREIHAIVKEHCKYTKQSISGCIEQLVELYIKKEKNMTNVLRVK